MYPLLFEIPLFDGLRIYTYGVLVAIAFMVGVLWTSHEAKLAGVPAERIMDLSFYIILSALVGSRVLYIVTDWERYLANPWDVLKLWEGGLVFYGGLIGAIGISLWYVKRHRLGFRKTADLFMPGVSLGHVIGRLGCFASGCCYGIPSNSPLAVVFPPNKLSLAPPGVPLLPVQLMESATELLIFGMLVFFRRRKKFDGQVFLIYLILYGMGRFVLEMFRGDAVRGFVIADLISTSQLISMGLVLAAAMMYFALQRQENRETR